MFKFNEYPEIKKAHEVSVKLDKKFYRKEFELEKVGESEEIKSEMYKIIEETRNYTENEYAKIIFDQFDPIKPVLKVKKTGEKIDWDAIFENKKFEELSPRQRKTLYLLVEGGYPYLLPSEYYNQKGNKEKSNV